jgi:hypothetical protein
MLQRIAGIDATNRILSVNRQHAGLPAVIDRPTMRFIAGGPDRL